MSDNIELLVGEVARDDSPEARQRLFRAIGPVEVFFPYNVQQRGGEDVKSTPLARLSDGTHAMMLFTSKLHPHLSEHERFAGGTFRDALTAALKMASLDWVILWNRASQRVVIGKNQILEILSDISPDENARASEMLEDLISTAVASKTDSLPIAIGTAIGDREIFLELSDEQSPDDQPQMKTFQIDHLSHVVRIYTSRRRPQIKYGGIRWEALKEMVRVMPEIGGIQIMNDADDWLVFDRGALGLNPSGK